jgi:hypothetical protein
MARKKTLVVVHDERTDNFRARLDELSNATRWSDRAAGDPDFPDRMPPDVT